MVVAEKGLIAAMNAAKNSTGYKVGRDDSRIFIYTIGWMVRFQTKKVPRKVLGLLAEHLGELPARNTAYEVKKRDVQECMFQVSSYEVSMFFRTGNGHRLAKTGFTYNGESLWLDVVEEKAVQIPPKDEALVDSNEPCILEDGVVTIQGDHSLVAFILPKVAEGDKDLMARLGAVIAE